MLDFRQHGCGVKQEIAAVPQIAIRHAGCGACGVGLLHECLDLAHVRAIKLLTGADVAVVRRRIRGRDAEGDDAPRGGGLCSAPARLAEFLRVAHDVVGGQHEHERVVITLRCEHGRDRDGGPRIAAARLEHDVGLDAQLAQLLGHHETKVGVGDDDRPREQAGIRNTREHLLECRPLSDEGDKLLGHALT